METVMETVSQLLRDGKSIPGIVQAMVDSEKFDFADVRDIFIRLGHYVAFSGDEHRGGMLIAEVAGPLEVGAMATSIHWGGNGGSSEGEIKIRTHPEEVLVGVLKKQGASIREIVAKLVEVGLTASELRDLFDRLGYRVHGGGYGEPEGWMLVGHPTDEPSQDALARIHWGGETYEELEIFAVSWN